MLGHYSTVVLETSSNARSGLSPKPFYGTLLKGELDRCFESVPSTFFHSSDATLLRLCYWHLRTLIALKLADAEPFDISSPVKHTVTQLVQNTGFSSPLISHFAMLATLALIELTSHESTREEAEQGLQLLLENSIASSTWDVTIRKFIMKKIERDSSTAAANAQPSMADSEQAAVAAQGLQHLADLATSRDVPNSIDERQEGDRSNSGPTGALSKRLQQPIREIIRDGYLSVFG